MKSVAESLHKQALSANMTINHYQIIFEYHKCCEQNQKCCNDAPWYSLAQETMVNTRSTVARDRKRGVPRAVALLINVRLSVFV